MPMRTGIGSRWRNILERRAGELEKRALRPHHLTQLADAADMDQLPLKLILRGAAGLAPLRHLTVASERICSSFCRRKGLADTPTRSDSSRWFRSVRNGDDLSGVDFRLGVQPVSQGLAFGPASFLPEGVGAFANRLLSIG
jgi:hypothetical protein